MYDACSVHSCESDDKNICIYVNTTFPEGEGRGVNVKCAYAFARFIVS